jgi:hypothetical protein
LAEDEAQFQETYDQQRDEHEQAWQDEQAQILQERVKRLEGQ